ncbi:glycine-rich RNA-binding protein blt801-like [Syzygium oleosum]|uniref:glycine-rich RNA-binding protein blt801-like n=1 Tax=Syzygium oleosum TaxID=219896 RepID=UPI0024BAE10C|nr:glycine-rich RNA-binding protein blt801-like [Syzygium oleosum]
MTRTLPSVRERSSEARPETQAMRYRVNTVASAVARGWPVRGAEEDEDSVDHRQVQHEGVAGEVGHELDADAREGRVRGPGGHEEEGGGGGGGGREGVGVAPAERGVDGGGEGGGVERKTGGSLGEDRGGRE